MVKPDWNNFRAKFSKNPQSYFEWFCYILFCKEFNRPNGIFRYVNQWRLETNPVEHEGEIIGWQSKFYDDTLSGHKDDILKAIRQCKAEYPEITLIIYYSNQDWGQGKKGAPPKGKTEIEDEASKNGFVIEWRTSSYFEGPSVAEDNVAVAQHFFSFENDVVRLIKEKRKHTDTILEEIGTAIEFNGSRIEIDRSEIIEKISNSTSSITIICGDGGVGKTAVVKKIYQKKNSEEKFLYLFRGIEFNTNDVNTLFGRCSLYEFVEFHDNNTENIAIIDSAEKLLEIDNQDPFKEFVITLLRNNWKILFTTRKHYLDDLSFFIIDRIRKTANVEHLNELTSLALEQLATEHSFNLPHDEKFFRPFAAFVLCLESDDIPHFLSPVLDSFCADDWVADLLDEFIIVEDGYNRYDNFWIVWNIFYDSIIKLCQKGYEYWYTGKIIKTYLFALTDWPDSYTSWNSLKKENSVFFEEFCRDGGQCPSVLYSVAKVLYDIGRIYLHDGIKWLAGVISICNQEDEKITEATVSYLEIIAKIYIYEQKQMVKRTPEVKSYVLIILSFLVEKGSVAGFMLRESIL